MSPTAPASATRSSEVMKKHSFPALFLLGLLPALVLPPSKLAAQADADDLLFTVGTTTAAEGGLSWVYLTWWSSGTELDLNPYGVYLKSGAPDSADPYTLAGIARPQTEPVTIQVLLSQAAALGDNLNTLEDSIDGLFDQLVPLEDLSLAQKIAAIVSAAPASAEMTDNLFLLSRRHPAMALASGRGFALPLPEGDQHTFEIRACVSTQPVVCETVVGRVTLTPGDFTILPAPGAPVNMPFVDSGGARDARGHLNAPLRWATPDDLRAQSLLSFGHNVYRMDADYAESEGFHILPPDDATVQALLADQPEVFRRINRLPVLATELLTPAEAANTSFLPDLHFVVDDNDRFYSEEPPFNDGDRFYYFVAARDLLGRDGLLSNGTEVILCSILPPAAPRNVRVSNDYSFNEATRTQTQIFRIEWDPVIPEEDAPAIAGYNIYRWHSIEEMLANQGQPTIPAAPGTGGRILKVGPGVTSVTDTAPGFPSITYTRRASLDDAPIINQSQAGVTWWYTVRAIDDSVCGGNLSPNSGPAFGVLRDRVGPPEPTGLVEFTCEELVLQEHARRQYQELGQQQGFPNIVLFGIRVFAEDRNVDWMEVYRYPFEGPDDFIGRAEIPPEANTPGQLFGSFYVRHADEPRSLVVVAGNSSGERSEPTRVDLELSPGAPVIEIVSLDARYESEKLRDCRRHRTVDRTTGRVRPLRITVFLTPTTQEWKVYRRVDNGNWSLFRQGLDSFEDAASILVEDTDLPLNGGRVCYAAQLFDEHGNPSQLIPIDCVAIEPRVPPPTPMLGVPVSLGETIDDAGALIQWFCSPSGVERFEFWIAQDGFAPDGVPSSELFLNLPPAPWNSEFFTLRAVSTDDGFVLYRSYVSRRVGPLHPNAPEYSLPLDIGFSPGATYRIRVRGLSADGTPGEWSNEETFVWSPRPDIPFAPDDCELPWPARSGMGLTESFFVPPTFDNIPIGLQAFINPTDNADNPIYTGGAVRVGLVVLSPREDKMVLETLPRNYDFLGQNPGENPIFHLPRDVDPEALFYHRLGGEALLPFALYRYQVPNEEWETVSGDVYQVSPLIEGIAGSVGPTFWDEEAYRVFDPYFMLARAGTSADGEREYYHIFVKDTQPVVQGAAYRYILVRYGENREVASALRLSPVSVP